MSSSGLRVERGFLATMYVGCMSLKMGIRFSSLYCDRVSGHGRICGSRPWRPVRLLCYIDHMRRSIVALAFVISAAGSAFGQACPKSSQTGADVPSAVRALEGQLVFHDDIRQWFELKLDEPRCGEASIQLVKGERTGVPIEVFRGCRVRSRGAIEFSSTGYFSLDMYQDAVAIESVGKCERQLPFPDYSRMRPDRAIREYRVEMNVNYEPGDHPVVFHVTSAGKELRPSQAHASYWLTGGFVLYGQCAKGFVVDEVFGTPEANPGHFDDPRSSGDMAEFDPESAAAAGKKDLQLAYTCVRER